MKFAGIEFCLENFVHMLLTLHAIFADEFGADNEGGEMLAVAVEFEMVAVHPGEDELLDLFGMHHGVQPLSFQPRLRSCSVSPVTAAKQAKTAPKLSSGDTSETPKKP